MPVIVVGADTPLGEVVSSALSGRGGEVRAFVTSPDVAAHLRANGVRTAVGDVSDETHVSGAALGCFTAILVAEAATDGRERSFSTQPAATVAGWVRAATDAGVRRLIWLGGEELFDLEAAAAAVEEVTAVAVEGRDPPDIAAATVRLDALDHLDEV